MSVSVRYASSVDGEEGVTRIMYIALAPFTLQPGVTEETLLKTSEAFESSFVQSQRRDPPVDPGPGR